MPDVRGRESGGGQQPIRHGLAGPGWEKSGRKAAGNDLATTQLLADGKDDREKTITICISVRMSGEPRKQASFVRGLKRGAPVGADPFDGEFRVPRHPALRLVGGGPCGEGNAPREAFTAE